MCFFKLEFKPGVGGGFLRAFASQKGPGKGLPASGFAPERRESPKFPEPLGLPGLNLNSTLPLPKPLGSSRILSDPPSPRPRPASTFLIPARAGHDPSSQPRPTLTSPHPSPGQTRPVSRPIPRLDTPRFPYKAQKQLQAHIKPYTPATKKNPTQAGHNAQVRQPRGLD